MIFSARTPRRYRKKALTHRRDVQASISTLLHPSPRPCGIPLSQSIVIDSPKIFGIGLSKTGTTSLTTALQHLGYRAIHGPTSIQQVRAHDAATDTTIAAIFEFLDQEYPGSRFIYTVRGRESWLRSCDAFWSLMQRYFDESFLLTLLHRNLYGVTRFDPVAFGEAYDRHHERVINYFASTPDRLLVLNIPGEDDPWASVCGFLGRDVPRQPFPHDDNRAVIDAMLLNLLEEIESIDIVSDVIDVAPEYLRRLRAQRSRAGEDFQRTAVNPGFKGFPRLIAERTALHVGSIGATARILGVPSEFVGAALSHSRASRRTKLRLKLRHSLAFPWMK
jgi:hypothetical protein